MKVSAMAGNRNTSCCILLNNYNLSLVLDSDAVVVTLNSIESKCISPAKVLIKATI